MNILNKLFGKNDNPQLTILKNILPKNIDLNKVKIYHIKSFEYTDENMKLFDKHKDDKIFYNILDKLKYNSQSNNVGVYYVVNADSQNEIYLLSDPFELYEKEYVMKRYNGTFDNNIMELSTVELIN